MSGHIFWLPSYPKSGNTLLRSILISLFFTEDGIFNLKFISAISQFENSNLIYKNKKIFNEDFKNINELATFYKYILKLQEKNILNFTEDFKFYKTHSGNFSIGNNPFTQVQNIRGYIYMIRDPRDVCISLSKHLNISIDKSIKFMSNNLQSLQWLDTNKNNIFFKEEKKPSAFLSSWDNHVVSWMNPKWKIPKLIIRYEDLVYKKEIILNHLINFFVSNYGFKFSNLEIKKKNIIESTAFDKLKNEEKTFGFSESSDKNKDTFFSVGKKNQWKSVLNKDQIKIINNNKAFRKIMDKFNYEISS